VKLQYLGDSRDAFKWDLLHWLCTRAEPAFARLLFVALLTADGRRANPSLTARTPVPTVRIAELAQPSEVGYRFCFRRPDLQVGASSFSSVPPSRPDDSEAARVFP